MEFKKYLKESAQQINREVIKILDEELERATKTDKKLTFLIKAFIKSCQGGKGIRGSLVKLGYQLAGGPSAGSKEIIKISAAYEIMHAAILAHDDIMDKSLTRRNKPSLYVDLGNNHYGISQAISLGDWGFFLSFKIISESKFDTARKTDALVLFSRTMMDTGLGQMLDLQKVNPLLVMKLKTAYYTIAGPLQTGALLAEADKRMVRRLGEFGENLGIAYQIRDDILDNEAGGTIGVGNTEREAQRYKAQALKVLPDITRGASRAKDKKMSKLLEQMAEYLVQRKK